MPRDHLRNRGVWVVVGRESGDSVEGWLVGEIPQGLIIARDKALCDLLLVPEYNSISYKQGRKHPTLTPEDPRQLVEELEAANDAISESMRGAISRLSYDRLHRLGHRCTETREEIHRVLHEGPAYLIRAPSTARDRLNHYLMAQADKATELHREVFEAFDEAGLPETLSEYGPRLAEFPPDFTIPAYDLEFATREDLTASLLASRDDRWTTRKHRAYLEDAEDTRTRLVVEATSDREEEADSSEEPDDSTPLSRWAGPSLRILAGTALSTANASVGVTAGLTSAVTTIGATVVPVYLGVATSIYTGFTQIAEGLEKIGRRK